ncbi:MAG TPA: hypothetical protein VMN56_18275 [Casimicrobiaceae bacterium]|nr:hypothetical protein [Casimicrobiaceae bacterium]
MRSTTTRVAAIALAAASMPAAATFQTFAIEALYSNADGSVQFVVLHETAGQDGGQQWAGRALTMTHGAVVKSFTFPADLPASATAGKRVLVATKGVAALGLVAPDYTMPDRFLDAAGGSLDFAGADSVAYAALPGDGATAIDRSGAPLANLATDFAGASASLPSMPVTAVEFYDASLHHYFVSDRAPDIDALDSGRIAGWARTGESFKVWPRAVSGASPVCRFYIPPQHGDSHFFSASTAECDAIVAKAATDPNYSGYTLETPAAFFVMLPDAATGACPAGTAPVYRLWNQRADTNHRYTTSVTVKAQMVAQGYAAEGYGPDAVAMCAPPGSATLQVVAGESAPYGTLVSDAASTATAAYAGFTTATDMVNVGPRSGSGEVIAFGIDRPVALQPAAWSTSLGDQLVTVPFAGLIEMPITIWVVAGPFATTSNTAITLWQTAQTLFTAERVGIRMSAVEIVDATANPSATAWSAFTCGDGNANVAALQSAIGARPNRINAYLVGLVDGSTSRGNACIVGGNFVAIAAGSGAELLAHELGHDLALEHIDDLTTDFNTANIMHSASNVRQFLTEGQVFRAHLRASSALNQVYAARPGQPLRDCDRDTLTLACPPIKKRLWADGVLPPN